MSEVATALTYSSLRFCSDYAFAMSGDGQILTQRGELIVRPGYDPHSGEILGLKLSSKYGDSAEEALFDPEVELRFGYCLPERFCGEVELPFLLPNSMKTVIEVNAELEPTVMDGCQRVSFVLRDDCLPDGMLGIEIELPAKLSAEAAVAA